MPTRHVVLNARRAGSMVDSIDHEQQSLGMLLELRNVDMRD